MSAFGLDPESVLARVRASATSPRVPTLTQSLGGGALGFVAVSLGVFALWATQGRWLQTHLGEGGFYAVCAAVFINFAGWALHRLVIGPGARARFYGLFAFAFALYAVGWCGGWFGVRGRAGEWLGALLGAACLGLTLGEAFGARRAAGRVIAVLFVAHSAGYFLGGWLYAFPHSDAGVQLLGGVLAKPGRATLGKLLWGAAYGVGLGAGLGYALHACQEPIRARLKALADANAAR
jgi:hypothetical protein